MDALIQVDDHKSTTITHWWKGIPTTTAGGGRGTPQDAFLNFLSKSFRVVLSHLYTPRTTHPFGVLLTDYSVFFGTWFLVQFHSFTSSFFLIFSKCFSAFVFMLIYVYMDFAIAIGYNSIITSILLSPFF